MELRHEQHVYLAHAMILSADKRLVAALAAIFALRLAAGGLLPLSADEAYYWVWSQHLAPGYFDHPPMVAWLIRCGTFLFGDTAFGVRAGGIALSFAATWFVWQSATLLSDTASRERHGALAALLFNLTLMIGVETLAATPDSPSIFTASVFLWALARFSRSHDGRWWLAAGAAAGLGLLSKYTALFLGAGALAWLVFSRPVRPALRTIWPYLGGVIALAIFLPNIWWNAQHHWATFNFQFGRVDRGDLTLRYVLDFWGAQLVLATPFLLALGCFGIAAAARQPTSRRFLIAAMILPATVYFIVHSLHARVEGNWPCFLYPALAIAAAEALRGHGTDRWRVREWTGRLTIPVAAMMLIAAYTQALMGIIPMGRKDPLARLLAVGLPEVTEQIETLRIQNKARAILTTDYATTGWLAFYMPVKSPVVLVGETFRFPDAPMLSAETARQPMLYVAELRHDKRDAVLAHFANVKEIARIDRKRADVVIAHYVVYRASWPYGESVGRVAYAPTP
ncbi:MAG: glycosyltransferase family 39 protein [Rhizomicrobium sp.]